MKGTGYYAELKHVLALYYEVKPPRILQAPNISSLNFMCFVLSRSVVSNSLRPHGL